jgi:hypothetical protein
MPTIIRAVRMKFIVDRTYPLLVRSSIEAMSPKLAKFATENRRLRTAQPADPMSSSF